MSWKITNEKLREKFISFGLTESDDGYWYMRNQYFNVWIMTSYTDTIRIIKGFVIKNEKIVSKSLSQEYRVFEDEKYILRIVKKLLKEFKILTTQLKLDKIQEDFE